MLKLYTKRNMFIHQELEEHDKHDGHKFDNNTVHPHFVNADPKNNIAEHKTAQSNK